MFVVLNLKDSRNIVPNSQIRPLGATGNPTYRPIWLVFANKNGDGEEKRNQYLRQSVVSFIESVYLQT